MTKLIVLACVALAIAAVGVTAHNVSISQVYVQLKRPDGVVWKHEWRW